MLFENAPMVENVNVSDGLIVEGLTKSYGRVLACNSVDLRVGPGEVRGLLGENGAGKSTLMRLICGLERPNRGEVRLWGSKLEPGIWASAYAAGVRMVHQNLSLIGALSVWENVALNAPGERSRARVVQRIAEVAEELEFDIDPEATVSSLAPSLRQRVEIIKCLWDSPSLVILDEPTSILSRSETEDLFRLLRRLVEDRQVSVLLVSHRLDELISHTDDVTVLRKGAVVGTYCSVNTTSAELGRAMLGSNRNLDALHIGSTETSGQIPMGSGRKRRDRLDPTTTGMDTDVGRPSTEPVLEFSHVSVRSSAHSAAVDDMTFALGRGEILGVAGVDGSGQEVIVELLSGLVNAHEGVILFKGEPLDSQTRTGRGGIGVIPSDRHGSGVIEGMSITDNLMFGRFRHATRHGLLDRKRIREEVNQLIQEYRIVVDDPAEGIETLSGGNQQKVVLARTLANEPTVLVASQPTQGLDVGAMDDMWSELCSQAEQGTGVLLISSEIDELLVLADRILVIFDGKIVGEVDPNETTAELLGRLMGGSTSGSASSVTDISTHSYVQHAV